MSDLNRRAWLRLAGLGSAATAALVGSRTARGQSPVGSSTDAMQHAAHLAGPVGRASLEVFNPTTYLRAWNFSDRPEAERARYYRETKRPDGSLLREYQLVAIDREIEIAPGVYFPAWTYNGQVPGPTIRCTEGDRIRVRFTNRGSHSHSIHFHGIHPSNMDGAFEPVHPGRGFVYEFDAEPYGLHLYHCHTVPIKRHIHKGLYGTFIIDPKTPRPPAHEFVMMMNAFDTNLDGENEVYAINTVAFHYQKHPIPVRQGELVRVYLVNVTEFDLLNSFHLHGNLFRLYRTGTELERYEWTDIVSLCQGERAVLEFTYKHPGPFMFHAHQSEFAELGWSGIFLVQPPHV
jgi:FtsP/CotA-like multicopper oxidase with cupredoxin domain